MDADHVGWISSAILLATLIRQVIKQFSDDGDTGVSSWLFIGQMAASAGFTLYSVMLDNPVFIATNACLLLAAVAGQVATVRRKRRQRAADASAGTS